MSACIHGPFFCRGTLIVGCVALLTACVAGGGGEEATNGTGDGTDGLPGLDDPKLATGIDAPAPPGCGNGELTDDEACDDGNREAGDGCAANCLSAERGFSCPPGQPCQRVARCGDGVVSFPELCDDGNKDSGDGCSATCKVETGYKCEGDPNVCSPTVCGDSVQEGAESCDDGNTQPYDGCSSLCQTEPSCDGGGDCSSECGDGLVIAEDCDDGNNVDRDGCSADCKIEAGYECTEPLVGGVMTVPIIYRDFRAGGDFEPGDAVGLDSAFTGLVQSALDADGKPVFAGQPGEAYITSAESFAQWYRDVPDTNSTTVTQLALYDDGTGRFVNRYGPNGEQWLMLSDVGEHWCGNVGEEVDGVPCTFIHGGTACEGRLDDPDFYECVQRDNTWSGIFIEGAYDGSPAFFPVDHDSFTPEGERATALITSAYGANWSPEPGQPRHNFHFTSEVRYWFTYEAGKAYVLDFTGDDDVWVFINGRLAVDLGGIHTPVTGRLDIGTDGSATVTVAQTLPEPPPAPTTQNFDLALTNGQVYEIVVFQAERKTTVSTFKLTLDGFATTRSECTPICGDGIVSLGEECDDGENDGGYGECEPGCVLGAFCGDGIVQEDEDCDDGNTFDNDDCGSACRNVILL